MKKFYIRKWMIAFLLLILGIAMLLLCYQMLYTPAMEECEQSKKTVEALELSIASAKANLQQQSYYIEETEKLTAQTDALLDSIQMPGQILEEDQILFIRDLEKATGQKQSSISFGTDSVLFSSGAFTLNEKTFPYSYSLGYDEFKELITYLVENEENPMSLLSLTISHDAETNTCSGTMILRRYFVTGIEEYVAPIIAGVSIGTENIFN